MSTNLSERAQGRVHDLRGNLLGRLRGHAPLTDRLEAVGSIDDGADVIVPNPLLDRRHRSQDAEPPDAALALMIVTGSSERENRQERKRLVVQADVQVREATLGRRGLAWMDEIGDEVSAVVTSHDDGWVARGADGGTPDPLWDGNINRYRLVSRYTVESWG